MAARAERADVVRNRQAILAAAERLIGERGAEAVSMDEIAAAAGVGKGTLFRHFGDRPGLVAAVVLQYRADMEAFTTEALDPDDPPVERLVAYIDAMLTMILRRRMLLAALDRERTDRRPPANLYDFWHAKLTELIAATRPSQRKRDDLDVEYAGHAVLALLRCDQIIALLDRPEVTEERIREGILRATRSLVS